MDQQHGHPATRSSGRARPISRRARGKPTSRVLRMPRRPGGPRTRPVRVRRRRPDLGTERRGRPGPACGAEGQPGPGPPRARACGGCGHTREPPEHSRKQRFGSGERKPSSSDLHGDPRRDGRRDGLIATEPAASLTIKGSAFFHLQSISSTCSARPPSPRGWRGWGGGGRLEAVTRGRRFPGKAGAGNRPLSHEGRLQMSPPFVLAFLK